MEFRPARCEESVLQEYLSLFQRCFPRARHYSIDYLRWLYADCPAGEVVGFDAYENERLIAHYVCVPAPLNIEGKSIRGALSLNTGTDPDYQGRGLFPKLASMTYDRAAQLGINAIIGVANANSTPGFIRKLGFQAVRTLCAEIGFGSLGVDDAVPARAQFRREWSPDLLSWRLRNSANTLRVKRIDAGTLGFAAPTYIPGLSCWAERPASQLPVLPAAHHASALGSLARLFIGAFPEGASRRRTYIPVPERLRSSPLNFIYKPLNAAPASIDGRGVFFDFLDFDAF